MSFFIFIIIYLGSWRIISVIRNFQWQTKSTAWVRARGAWSHCTYMTRGAASDRRVMDASAEKIMTYFAANAWSTMTCYTDTGISTSTRRKFPFGRKTYG